MEVVLHFTFFGGLLLLAALHNWQVVVLLGFVCAIVGIYFHACTIDKLDEDCVSKMIVCVVAMFLFLGFAASMTVTECSMCLTKGTATQQSLEHFMIDCAYYKSSFQSAFGNKTDAKNWPNCFDDWGKWNPCDVRDFTEIELTCKKP